MEKLLFTFLGLLIASGAGAFAQQGGTTLTLGSATLIAGKYYYQSAAVSGDGIHTLSINLSGNITTGDAIALPTTTPDGGIVSTTASDYIKSITFSGGASAADVQGYLRQVGFTLGGASQTVNVTVSTDNSQTNSNVFYNSATQHYYQYIPASSSGITWTAAYTSAKGMTYMGRNGYLATVMSKDEDVFLNNLSGGKVGWLGGTILTNSGSRVDASGATAATGLYYSSFTTTSVVTGTAKGWYWACGPEIGTRFYDINSLYDETGGTGANAATATTVDNRNASTYYNWSRTGSYEPNNLTATQAPGGNDYETCLTTLKNAGFTGKQGTAFTWNDCREWFTDQSSDWTAKGYFVEYGNLSVGDDGSGSTTTFATANGSLGASPTVTSISPTSGLAAGGTSVTITGNYLSSATSVKFGSSSATITANTATSITATSPAHSAGTVDIAVTTTYGASATSSADQFTYTAADGYTLDFEPASGTYTGFNTSKTATYYHTGAGATFTITSEADYVWNAIWADPTAYHGSGAAYFGYNDFETGVTVSIEAGKSFNLLSFYLSSQGAGDETSFTITTSKGGSYEATLVNDLYTHLVTLPSTSDFQGITWFKITPPAGGAIMVLDDIALSHIAAATPPNAQWGLAGTGGAAPSAWASSGPLADAMTYANGLSSGTAYIQLLSNVNTTAPLAFVSGTTTILDLNGLTINRGLTAATSSGNVITVAGTLTLKDGSTTNVANQGGITGGYNDGSGYGGGVNVTASGNFTMRGGNIIGNKSANPSYGGGGVCVNAGGSGVFSMTGGSIAGNSASSWGGGVGVYQGGSFTMTGGSITGNSTSNGNANQGGGVYSFGSFTVGGTAVISDNTNTSGGSAVERNYWVGSGNAITVSTTTPLTNGASIGITANSSPTSGSPVNITGNNSADYSGYFTSDNGSYVIRNSGSGSAQVVQLAVPGPTVTSISPVSGSPAGGTSVTITGTGFTGATAARFGGTVATSFTVVSSTSITVTAPAGSAGVVDITVTTAAGTSATSSADQFTYIPDYVLINGVKWATHNAAAPGTWTTSPEDAGMFYQWNNNASWAATGTVTGWNSSWNGGFATPSSADTWATANDPSPAGYHAPTKDEINTLLDASKVTATGTTRNGVNGMLFTDKINNNSIFLPASGYRSGSDGALSDTGSGGYYWSRTAGNASSGYYLYFGSGYASLHSDEARACGFSVRPVFGPALQPVAYTRSGPALLRINISQLLTNAAGATGTNLTLISLSASTNGVTVQQYDGYLIYQTANTVADQFSYGVTNSTGDAATGVVNIVPASLVAGQVQNITLTGGTVSLKFSAIPGVAYTIQRSTDLANWADLASTNAPAAGVFDFEDANPPSPSGYYRLRLNY